MIVMLLLLVMPVSRPTIQPTAASGLAGATVAASGPAITDITTNLADYPNDEVPRYEKLEITFQVATVAKNPQLPYDPSPPPGLEAGIGVTVNALFTPDDWQTVYTQPAFYYEGFEDQIKSGREWFYPTGNFSWKVRFAPNEAGLWQYKLTAQDAGGIIETQAQSFTVAPSDNKGFVRVSQKDPRYFEFEDGTYFPALGYNMNFNHISWDNPVLDNQEHFQIMKENGVQLIRFWFSQWGIFTSAWSHWNSPLPERHGQYIPYPSLRTEQAYPGSDVSMGLVWNWNPGMFLGFMKGSPAAKRNTTYHIFIRYLVPEKLQGPRIEGKPYGLVTKTGGWLTGPGSWPDNVYGFVDPGTGTVVSDYAFESPTNENGEPQWSILEGELNTANQDFLPFFYLVLENVGDGPQATGSGTVAYIDRVEIREDLGNGQYGPNVVTKDWMAQHYYFDQRNSYAFDKVLELAEQYAIYLRPVIMEKNEWILNRIDYDGNMLKNWCSQEEKQANPDQCPDNKWFYGNWRQTTKVRWLQQAWWRYLQARWDYSTNIHSWELLNEGDPWNGQHYTLADEFGKYMHQFKPNDHMVSTSTWHSFPKDNFWANPEYPNVDFADIHKYIGEGDPNFYDAALATQSLSMQYGALRSGGAGKPVIRGETGFVVSGSGPATDRFGNDAEGVWLHNFIWGGINSGGLIESYWYENTHIYDQNRDGTYNFDHRDHYGAYYNFVKDIPLNNGYYQDAQAIVSNDELRAWGQKDLVNGRTHLWIQNKNHTWKNVVDGVSIPAVSGTVEISGFQLGGSYTIEWWDTYQPNSIIQTDIVVAEADGSISIPVDDLATDVAIKIIAIDNSTPTATPAPAISTPTATSAPPTSTPTSTTTPTDMPTFTATPTTTVTPTATDTPTETPAPPTSTPTPTSPPGAGARVADELQVLYTFEEGTGTTVHDVSGVGAPLNLTLGNPAAATWVPGGLAINASAILASHGPAAKVINAARTTGELTIEAWIKPANTTQDGPARIVTLSQDPNIRNFTLAQGLWGTQPSDVYDVRLRTTATSSNGTPSLTTPAGFLTTGLTHVVYTRDASGAARTYVNGVERASGSVGGDFSNWDGSYRLALANELTGDRPWRGELHLVANYNRALSPAEVSQNFAVGPNGVTPTTLALYPGRNMISLPTAGDGAPIEGLLAPLAGMYDAVYAYDSTDTADPWKKFDPNAPAYVNDLTRVNAGTGLLIDMLVEANLTLSGTWPAQVDISIRSGWNLVGFPGRQAQPVGEALASMAGKYDQVYYYDPTDPADPWKVYDVQAGSGGSTLELLSPGRAYWIHATQGGIWTITN